MLTALPVETVLEVLTYIPLRQLQRIPGLSREWMTFFTENEPSIYRAAAVLHGFVPSHATLEEGKTIHRAWLAEVQTWKTLCKKHYTMEVRWEGNGSPRYAAVSAAGEAVHRFKVDPEQRTVITTCFNGGLRVSAIDEDEVLWSLPQSLVQPWAHCEYDRGFLVFTRLQRAMEVWRRKRDVRVNPSSPIFPPDLQQESANLSSWQSPISISQDDRGAFVPWTLIIPPSPVLASRLVFPTLLIASLEAQEAYLYDVVTGTLKQTISLRRPQDPPVDINYVELGTRHIFVCTENDVLVIPRDTANSRSILKFPSQVEDFDGLYAERSYTINGIHRDDTLLTSEGASPILQECSLRIPTPTSVQSRTRARGFTAVHVSPCGCHFVACDMKGCLYLVREFEQAIHGRTSLTQCVTILDVFLPITYLALHEDKRLCIHVQNRGIFIVPFLSAENAVSMGTLDMLPKESHPRLLHANRIGLYDPSPCIQLTRTQLWTKKYIDPVLGLGRNRLRYLDFTTSQ